MLQLTSAFAPDLSDAAGSALLLAWNFVRSFADVLGVRIASPEALADLVVLGPRAPGLASLHIALLRLLQADVEEAHAIIAVQVPMYPSFRLLPSVPGMILA